MALCEIRIPTYKRPHLLRRAIDNLRRQTLSDLHCIIFDDSPEQEARAVAEETTDIKVFYRPNPENLGISRNVGQCFRTAAYEPAQYCFCLEDDNTVFPTFIEQNIADMQGAGTAILIRDQFIENNDDTIDETRRTMQGAFPPAIEAAGGIVQPVQLLTSILTRVGISNGALFWRADARSELQIGDDCPDPVFLEYLRPFAIREPVLFAPTPLGTWRDNQLSESFRVQKDKMKDRLSNYSQLKTLSALRRQAVACLAPGTDIEALYGQCDPSRWGEVDRVLGEALFTHRPRALSAAAMWKARAKGLVCQAFPGKEIAPASAGRLAAQLDWLQAG